MLYGTKASLFQLGSESEAFMNIYMSKYMLIDFEHWRIHSYQGRSLWIWTV